MSPSSLRRFRLKSYFIDAVQWWKNGDHPDDGNETFIDSETKEVHRCEGKVVRYYRHPDVPGDRPCIVKNSRESLVQRRCEFTMHDHGWIEDGGKGLIVCPGDWVVYMGTGTVDRYQWVPIHAEDFEARYEPVPRPVVDLTIPDAIERRAAAIRRAHWHLDDDLRSWPEFVSQSESNDGSEVALYRRLAMWAEAGWDDEEELVERVAIRLHRHGHDHGACFEAEWADEDDVIRDSLRDQAREAIVEMTTRQVR